MLCRCDGHASQRAARPLQLSLDGNLMRTRILRRALGERTLAVAFEQGEEGAASPSPVLLGLTR